MNFHSIRFPVSIHIDFIFSFSEIWKHVSRNRFFDSRFTVRSLLPMYLPIPARETLIQSLSDFTLGFLRIARNNLTRIASYLRKAMTKLCIKILVKADSAIESAFPWGLVTSSGVTPLQNR